MSENDYQSCTINFDAEGNAIVSITGKGKFKNMSVCSGTKSNATISNSCNEHYTYEYYVSEDKKEKCIEFVSLIGMDDAAESLCNNEGYVHRDYYYTTTEAFDSQAAGYKYSFDDFSVENGGFVERRQTGIGYNTLAYDWFARLGVSDIQSIIFYKSLEDFDSAGIDLSNSNDNGIYGYAILDESTNLYDISIASNEEIYLPTCCNSLFGNLSNIKQIDFNNSVNTSNVTNMAGMFVYYYNLIELNLGDFDTSNVICMYEMFEETAITSIDISSFDMSNVTSTYAMFGGCINLVNIYTLDNFQLSVDIYSEYMFDYCTSLVGGSGTAYDSNHINGEYAHIDGGTSNPGYFTDINDKN